LGHRNAVVAHDVPEHREVIADAGRYFTFRDKDSLALHLNALLDDPAAIKDLRRRAALRARHAYSWDAVADQYEAYLLGLAGARRRAS
jgi:glycosyltransferase involved in cell wall biosynthesis